MNRDPTTQVQSADEVADLRARLQEAEETLRAIRHGEVDAVVVQGPRGVQLYTLKGADEPYRVLVEEMNQGAVTLSAEGTILYCNRRFAALLKRPIEQIIGFGFASFVAASEQAAFAALLQAGASGRSAGEMTLHALDGGPVPLQLALSSLPADSAVAIGLVATDISESRKKEARLLKTMADLVAAQRALAVTNQRLERQVAERLRAEREIGTLNAALQDRAEQLEASNKEIEAFSYSVSHDLRAPLRHVQGYAELLGDDAGSTLSSEARRYLQVIAGAGREMGELVDGLLSFLRMNRIEMRAATVDLNALVRDCIRELERAAGGRNIGWKLAALPAVTADAAMLGQVFAHLLGNAVKYTGPREAAVIEVGCAGGEDGRAVLFVRDNGVGFDMRYAGKLFGVFQRLHGADEFEGRGIGLANVRRIIARHGGRVWAEARPGEGATVYFTLKTPEFAARADP